MHDVAVLHYVILTFHGHFAGFFDFHLGLVLLIIGQLDDLGADEALLEIGVDDAGGGGRFVAAVDGLGAHFLHAGREVGNQV